jgi:hypothetical protein
VLISVAGVQGRASQGCLCRLDAASLGARLLKFATGRVDDRGGRWGVRFVFGLVFDRGVEVRSGCPVLGVERPGVNGPLLAIGGRVRGRVVRLGVSSAPMFDSIGEPWVVSVRWRWRGRCLLYRSLILGLSGVF